MKQVAFYTLGCKVNMYETNAMEQQMQEAGYTIVDFNEPADIYIINTCTVTNMSDKKSRQMIHRAKQRNPEAMVVAVGCYAQVAKEKLESIEGVDLILGNNEKKDIVKYIKNYKGETYSIRQSEHGTTSLQIDIKDKTGQPMCQLSDVSHQKEFVDFGTVEYLETTRAIIKVQDGCNMFCTYCIIPYARGRIRSRSLISVKKEVEALANKGIKEVVVTGIHVASYGKDLPENIELIDLLENINKVKGIERIRLGSLEPTIITESFLDRLVKLEKICHHFHLSLQSGCNETLKRMNRKYTIEAFKEAVNLLRTTYDDVVLTTDIIVGFPGETEEEFAITYQNLKDINFYKMHVFKYSRRAGTVADKMPNQVETRIQEERSKKLLMLSDQNQEEYNKQYIGKQVEVLFEEQDGGAIKGHTANYLMVKVKNKNIADYHNKITKVKVTDALQAELIAYIAE